MKSLAAADAHGWTRYVAHQVYYSLVGRDYEWELMPLAHDQGVGAVVWSPLGWGRLTGKIRRGRPLPEGSRLHETAQWGPPVDDDLLYDVVDVLDELSEETGRTVPQIALNWLLRRPTVASVIIGARNETPTAGQPRRDRLGAHRRPGRPPRQGQRQDRPVPLLPVREPGGIRTAEPADHSFGQVNGRARGREAAPGSVVQRPRQRSRPCRWCHIGVQAGGDNRRGFFGLSFGSRCPCMSRFRRAATRVRVALVALRLSVRFALALAARDTPDRAFP